MATRTYKIRVNGLVPIEPLTRELHEIEVAQHERRTVLSGQFVDQAALYGFLDLLRSHGLEVVEVRRLPLADADQDEAGGGG